VAGNLDDGLCGLKSVFIKKEMEEASLKRRKKELAISSGKLGNSFSEIHISLFDLCISRKEVCISLLETHKSKEEICISFKEIGGEWLRQPS